MNKKAQTAYKKIISDKTSGSGDLLIKLNEFCKKYFFDIEHPIEFIEQTQNHFSSFRNIQEYFTQLKAIVHSKQLSEKFFEKYRIKNETAYGRIFTNALPFLRNKKSILTISNSRTVFETIKKLATVNSLKLTICESRPRFEGRILAKKLAMSKIKIELITEAMASAYVRKCDCTLIGADIILKDGSVVNKVGSLQLALLCRHFKKPFYVVAEKSKFSKSKKVIQREELPDEIWKNPPEGIAIKNFYFEKIPGSLITKIFTDE